MAGESTLTANLSRKLCLNEALVLTECCAALPTLLCVPFYFSGEIHQHANDDEQTYTTK
jgi:hypothetical protein